MLAGHSKWQNIRHIKAAKDKARATMISKYINSMKIAVREGKSANPNQNRALATLVEQAKSHDVPHNTINEALKRFAASKAVTQQYIVGGHGPNGSFFIVETETEKTQRTRHNLTFIMSKYGVKVVDMSNIKSSFEQKGLFLASDNMTLDAAEEIAIEAGAEEVQKIPDPENENGELIQFLCDAADFYAVKKNLESTLGDDLRSAQLEYLPISRVELNDGTMSVLSKMIEKLEEEEDVVRIIDNIA